MQTQESGKETERGALTIPPFFDEYLSPEDRAAFENADEETQRQKLTLMYAALDGRILPSPHPGIEGERQKNLSR